MPRLTGTLEQQTVAGESFAAFVPAPLPPLEPPILLDDRLRDLLQRAQQGLERLDTAVDWAASGAATLDAFVRREALASCQLAGSQATLVDLLADEAGAYVAGSAEAQAGSDLAGVADVRNYLAALAFCRKEMKHREGPFPSLRLLHETHSRCLRRVRGPASQPGRLRTIQTWIGGARPDNALYVPPPTFEVARLMRNLLDYLHRGAQLPPLVRAGLLHVQFASIHPYLDGNGRMGRLLVTLLLEALGPAPRAHPPLERLPEATPRRVPPAARCHSRRGRLGELVALLPRGVATISAEALATARSLSAQVTRDRDRALRSARASVAALRLLDQLPRHPLVSIPQVVQLLATTPAHRRQGRRAPRDARHPRRGLRPPPRPDVQLSRLSRDLEGRNGLSSTRSCSQSLGQAPHIASPATRLLR